MASVKRVLEQSGNLFGAPVEPSPRAKVILPPMNDTPARAAPTLPAPAPKLSLVPPPPEDDTIVEADGAGRFWMTFVRHDGTSRGAILITRSQLEKFLKRGAAALEVG